MSRGGVFCVPTHTWDNLGTDKITLDLTKHETNLGAFTQVALDDSRAFRTENPTHSCVLFGDLLDVTELATEELDVKTPTSPLSIYGKLHDRDAYVLLVGVDQNSNTYLHSVEEMLGIPNRVEQHPTRVSVKRTDGEILYRDVYMFDESVHGDVSHKFYMYEPLFRHLGAISDGFIGSAKVMLCSTRLMKQAIEYILPRCIDRDPLLFDGEIPEDIYLDAPIS